MASGRFLFLDPTDSTSSSQARSHAMTQWRHRRAQKQTQELQTQAAPREFRWLEGRRGPKHAEKSRPDTLPSSKPSRDPSHAYASPNSTDDGGSSSVQLYKHATSGGQSIEEIPSPMSPLGAGKLDPFQSFAVAIKGKRVFELLDFCASHIYPGFMDVDRDGTYAPLTCAWIPAAMRSPAYFHACLFGISAFLERRMAKEDLRQRFLQEQLTHKVESMRYIQRALKEQTELPDEIILAVFQLACNELKKSDITQPTSTFYPLLQSLQWLDIYGEVDFVEEHWAAFTSMIDQRGGIQSIRLTGVKDMIRLADCLRASKKICSPSFPNFNLEEVLVKSPITPLEVFHPTTFASLFDLLKTRGVGDGFKILTRCGLLVNSEAIAVFSDLSLLSATLEEWSRGTLRHPYMIDIANIRLNIQYRLLSLPSVGELEEPYTDSFSYEACRLTAILYAVSITFPVPPQGGPQAELVRRIKNALSLQENIPQELLLWCLMIGGIAAAGQEERVWFANQTGETCRALQIISWQGVKDVLRKFAWLERSCEPGGQAFLSIP